MTEATEDWTALMRAGVGGDEKAYARLLRLLTPRLRVFARAGLTRAGRSTAEAEDIVQETLIAIHVKRSSWMVDQPVEPWIRAILKYKLIDALRRRGATGEVDIDALAEVIASPSQEQEIATSDVVKLAEGLPDGQRKVIRAMFVEEKNTAETAEALAMSEGAVRVALHRGLAGLSRILKGTI